MAARKKKILIVDDEASVVSILRRRLEAEGYDVLSAPDGTQGLEQARTERPDLIISDVSMPRMDGYTFVKTLRATPELSRIPVIVLTGKEGVKDLFFFEGVAECDYLVKPFEAPEIIEKITTLLARVERHLGHEPPSK